MSHFIKNLFNNKEQALGKVLALLTMTIIVIVVNAPGTFAAFWRTVAGNSNIYATGLSDANSFVYGYGHNDTRYGYGYGYGYGVYNTAGYFDESGDVAYASATAATAATLSTVSTITGTAAAATNVTLIQTASVSGTTTAGNTITAVLPSGLEITKSDGTAFDSTAIAAASSTLTNIELGSANAPYTIISFGVTGTNLRFDKPVQITIPVPSANIGASVSIGALHTGDTSISSTSIASSSSAACSAGVPSASASTATVTAANTVVIYTCAASKFVAYAAGSTTTTTTTTTSGGGGGGGSIERGRNKATGQYVNGKADKGGFCKTTTVAAAVETPVTTDDYEPGEVAVAFMDTASHWANSYIEQLRAAGIVHGKRPGAFEPNAPLTRGELVKIALNAFGVAVPTSATVKPFTDVETSAWYAPYIAKAKELGIVQGYSNGAFKPNQTINRAEALKILIGASGLDVPTDPSAMIAKGWTYAHFADVPVSAWYAAYVDYAKTNAVVSGYANGLFGPGNPVLRGEMAKMVAKVMELAK